MRGKHFLVAAVIASAIGYGSGQTISVDITPSHIRKIIIPNQMVGAGIDRIPQGVTDSAFTNIHCLFIAFRQERVQQEFSRFHTEVKCL